METMRTALRSSPSGEDDHGQGNQQGRAGLVGLLHELDREILADAARLRERDLRQLSREGFTVHFYESLEEFYLAEALEYVEAWRRSTPDNPAGICGPIGPTEQLSLVARIVDAGMKLHDAHFWGMDEWVENGQPVAPDHPLSFARADMELCFNRIDKKLRMPAAHLHFPTDDLKAYRDSYDQVRCLVMQGGQGEVKHWAFNDPPRRAGEWRAEPPPPQITASSARASWTFIQ